ncbi:MAG TPA: tetratricopeptide repeat protein [bacterium]|nr:tetratricopeptide repeat protein [bacterium]
MSLIHEALKKAQDKEKALPGSGLASFQEQVEPPKSGLNMRTIVLGSVLLLAVGFFVYTKFLSGDKDASKAPTPAPAIAPQAIGEKDAGRLKKNAIDAYTADDLDSAWASLSTASNLDPKDPEIWNNMGLVARKRGDLLRARQCYEKALEIKPDYPEALNNIAVLSLQGGDVAKAQGYLEKAVKLSPAYPEGNFHLAMVYEQKGEKSKAVEYYKRFLEVSGNLPSNMVDQVRDHVMGLEK